jgi:hypothetical protein
MWHPFPEQTRLSFTNLRAFLALHAESSSLVMIFFVPGQAKKFKTGSSGVTESARQLHP